MRCQPAGSGGSPTAAFSSGAGELVAKLFAEHYPPMHFAPGQHEAVAG